MKMRSADPIDFFRPNDPSGDLLRERAAWLESDSERHAVSLGRTPWVEALHVMACDWGFVSRGSNVRRARAFERVLQLGRLWEPDFLVVAPNAGGQFELHAGCVCFPSGWGVESKVGRPLSEIHGVVPGLNESLEHRINTFLQRIKPGMGWLRANWGMSSSSELNQHPERHVNQMDCTTDPAATWVRIEHQLLTRIGDTDAILFGIRLENVPLVRFREDERLAAGLRRALSTMPEAMLRYKNLLTLRPQLIRYLA